MNATRLPPRAADFQAMADVSGDALDVECGQVAAHRDPLVDLPHLRKLQAGLQLGLPDEHDLEQLLLRSSSDRIRISSSSGSDRFCASSMTSTANACSGTSESRNS